MSFLSLMLDLLFPRKELERAVLSVSYDELAEKLSVTEKNGAVSFFSYRDPLIRQMIWMLKYQGNRHVAELFGRAVAEYLLEDGADAHAFNDAQPILVPMPLSHRRARERGFNQMVLVGKAAASGGAFLLDDTLLARRHTVPQTSLKRRREREQNVVGAFKLTKPAHRGRMHVLIDDVVTTGSTMAEARKALRAGGASSVRCIALAH